VRHPKGPDGQRRLGPTALESRYLKGQDIIEVKIGLNDPAMCLRISLTHPLEGTELVVFQGTVQEGMAFGLGLCPSLAGP